MPPGTRLRHLRRHRRRHEGADAERHAGEHLGHDRDCGRQGRSPIHLPTATDAADPSPWSSARRPPAPSSRSARPTSPAPPPTRPATARPRVHRHGRPTSHRRPRWLGPPVGRAVAGSPAALSRTRAGHPDQGPDLRRTASSRRPDRPSLRVVACGGDTALVLPLSLGSGRWNAHLDMSLLSPAATSSWPRWRQRRRVIRPRCSRSRSRPRRRPRRLRARPQRQGQDHQEQPTTH